MHEMQKNTPACNFFSRKTTKYTRKSMIHRFIGQKTIIAISYIHMYKLHFQEKKNKETDTIQ